MSGHHHRARRFVGAVMELCEDRRGTFKEHRVPRRRAAASSYEMPLAEIAMTSTTS